MDFHVLRFSGKSKRDLFQEVSMWLAVGYKKKKNIYIYIYQLGILNGNPPWGQIFQRRNLFLLFIFYCKSVFQNFNPDLPIESTQNFRAVFPILAVILDSSEQKYDYFYIVNNFKAFRLSIKAILDSKFLQNWFIHVQPTCSRTWRGEGRVRLHVG